VTRRGRAVLRVIALLCLVVAIALVVAVARPDEDVAEAAAAAPVPTPLFSPRRVPMLFADAAARAEVDRELEAEATSVDACVSVEDDRGVVASVHPEAVLSAASTTKLLTGAAALKLLGPDYTFRTNVLRDESGAITVVGGGDPTLATDTYITHEHALPPRRAAQYTPLATLADAIVAAGVTSVPVLNVVDTRHDSLRYLPDWKPGYAQSGEVGALGALTVDGGFRDPIAQVPSSDPALTAGQRLAELLSERGVSVGGVQRGEPAGGATEIAHVDSPPLSTIVGDMVRGSDNYTAETVMRELAATGAPEPATTAAGVAKALEVLRGEGVPVDGIDVRDGSGLARDTKLRCDTLLSLVELAARPEYKALDDALAVAGRTGTLAIRFLGDPLAGRLRAKTGSLDGVTGLAGVIDGPHPLRFAFLAGGNFSYAGGQQLQADIAHVIASYPDPGAGKDLVPAP
jgi:serine-type D-Ala-D-Ala carboxypeptidase/endopeptidase (penicillin-binding protein 4)